MNCGNRLAETERQEKVEVERPGTAGGSNKLTLATFWLSWPCVPVLVTDRRAKQSRPSQGKTREEENKEEKKRCYWDWDEWN